MRAEEGFQFPAPVSVNRWEVDAAFRAVIVRHLSREEKSISKGDVQKLAQNLSSFGQRVRDDYTPIAATMNNFREEPYLIQYDAWGKRVDQLVTSAGWKELKKVAAREAIVGESYGYHANTGGGRSKLGGGARVYAFARSIMFGPASKVVLCPISMTDGAVRVLELFGTQAQKEAVIPRLVSTDPRSSWTAGQFMTERPGGSDVSQTETTATAVDASKTKAGDKFILNGFKWFSSATDGDVALALARTDQSKPDSSRGLSLFLIRMRDEETKKLNGIRVHRLKNKMGTKYLPTAELELDQCVAELVGELGRGVATISSVLNITRLYSASGALAGLGHGLQIATHFASQRKVMGSATLSDLPLHTATLLQVVVVYRSLLQLFFHNVLLMGRSESGTASPRESLRLRFLTPALKAFCATRSSEGYIVLIESLGGQGYMEENGLAEGLRDLTVERIWEGTPAILSLDLLRVMMQSRGAALVEFIEDNTKILAALPQSVKEQSARTIDRLQAALQDVGRCMQQVDLQKAAQTSDYRIGRPLLDCVMTIQAGVLLLEQAAWASSPDNADYHRIAQFEGQGAGTDDVETARLWVLQGHGDLDRSLASLSSLASEQNAAAVGQRLVYGSSSRSSNL